MILNETIDSNGTNDTMFRSLRCHPRRIQWWAVVALVVIVVLIFWLSVPNNDNAPNSIIMENQNVNHPRNIHKDQKSSGHSMCILIPFRDRFEELTEFVPKITKFLQRQNVKHKIVVINQVCKNDFLLFLL
jgi:hypothetical protein